MVVIKYWSYNEANIRFNEEEIEALKNNPYGKPITALIRETLEDLIDDLTSNK